MKQLGRRNNMHAYSQRLTLSTDNNTGNKRCYMSPHQLKKSLPSNMKDYNKHVQFLNTDLT